LEDIGKITLLFLVSALSQFPLSLIRFIAPLYALQLGAGTVVLGLMGASYGTVYLVLASFFGRYAGRFGHGKMVAVGLFLYALVIALYPLIRNPCYLIFIRGGEAVGMSLVWPSIEASSKIVNNMKRSLMVYTLSWSAASSAAPYAGARLMSSFWLAILIAFVLSVAGAIASLAMPNFMPRTEKKAGSINTLTEIVLPIFAFGFNAAVISSFYPAYGKGIIGVVDTGTVMTIAGAFMTVAFAVSGFISDESAKLTTVGLLLQLFFLPVFMGLTFSVQLVSISLVFFGQGLMYFNVLLRIVSYFSENVGAKTGIFESSIGAGSVLGPIAAGIPTALALKFPWLLCFSVSLLLFVSYGIFRCNLLKKYKIRKNF